MTAKKIKLTMKEKVSIVRDALIQHPRYWAYGWNRSVIKHFKKEYDINITESYLSKLKKKALKQIEEDKSIVITKQKLVEMHLNDYEGSKKQVDKTRCLTEIGKLEGHYIETVAHTGIKEKVVIYVPDNGRNKKTEEESSKKKHGKE